MTKEEIKKMSSDELKLKITEFNEQLKSFGWKNGIGQILFGCGTHGHIYESIQFEKGKTKPTPMNCFAVIAHNSPDLIINLIHKHEFEAFLMLISKLGMTLEIAIIKLSLEGNERNILPKEWM